MQRWTVISKTIRFKIFIDWILELEQALTMNFIIKVPGGKNKLPGVTPKLISESRPEFRFIAPPLSTLFYKGKLFSNFVPM